MAKEQLIVEVITEAKAAIASLKQYVKEVEGTRTSIGKLTKLFKSYWVEILSAYAAVRKISQITKEYIKASNEQERVIANLNSTLKATGRLTPDIVKNMTDWAGAMQKVTVYSDETIVNAQAVLAVYDNIATETFPEVIKTAMDLSTIMGTDLTEATRSLAIALTDPEQGLMRLRRAGVIFTDEQKKVIKEMIRFGDTARAQGYILDIIKGKVGGAAEAYGKTLAGQLGIAKNQIDEVKETLGDLIKTILPFWLEQLTKGTEALNKFLDAIQGINKTNDEFKKQLSGMTKKELQNEIDKLKERIKVYEENARALNAATKDMELTKRARKEAAENLKFEIEMLAAAKEELNKYSYALKTYNEKHKEAPKVTKEWGIALKEELDEQKMLAEGYGRTTEAVESYIDVSGNTLTILKTQSEYVDELVRNHRHLIQVLDDTKDPLEKYMSAWETAKDFFDPNNTGGFRQAFEGTMESVWTSTTSILGGIKETIKGVVSGIVKMLASYYAKWAAVFILTGQWGKAVKYVAASAALYALSGAISKMQQGGQVMERQRKMQVGGTSYGDRQPAMLEAGETVIPKEISRKNAPTITAMMAGEGKGAMIKNVIYLDKKVLFEAITQGMEDGKIQQQPEEPREMRFLYHNLVDEYTLAASSEATGYPATNVQDPQLAKAHRTTVLTSQTWLISASATVLTASTAVILGHNLSATATAYIQGNDTDVWAAATTSVLFSTYATIMSVAFTEATHRYWRFRIDNDGNSSTFLSIGRLELGAYLDWTRGIGIDFPLEYIDTSTIQYSRTGQVFGNEGIIYRVFRLAFPYVTDTERKSLETMFSAVKMAKPIVWWPDENYATSVETVYCVFNDNLTFNHMLNYKWNGATALREVF